MKLNRHDKKKSIGLVCREVKGGSVLLGALCLETTGEYRAVIILEERKKKKKFK